MVTFAKLITGIASLALIMMAVCRAGGNLCLCLERRGRHHRDVRDGNRRHADAGSARRGAEASDADVRQPGQALPLCRGPHQALYVFTYAIDPKTGALKQLSKAPLAESFPYISTDKTGRYLFGAGYGANLVSVNAIAKDGKISDPLQVIPTARNAHSIRIDNTNRYRLRSAPRQR